MTGQLPAQCFACTRLTPTESPTGAATAVRCGAYPSGIPAEISLLCGDHRTPRGDEQGGLVFDRATGAEADWAWTWWVRFARAEDE
jgi:hypothetical protein